MNGMSQEDWALVDASSRGIVRILLEELGASNVQDTHGKCAFDLTFELHGKTYGCEVKDRGFEHTKFGDIFAEAIKKDCNDWWIKQGRICQCLVVNCFIDGVIAIANLDDPEGKKIKRWCKETTLVKGGSQEWIQKDCLSIPQRKLWKVELRNQKLKFTKLR